MRHSENATPGHVAVEADWRLRLRATLRNGLALRILAAVLLFSFVAPEAIAPDQVTYDYFGQALADYWVGNRAVAPAFLLKGDPPAYFSVVAVLYLLFGRWMLLPALVNCLVGAWSVSLTFDIARRITGDTTVALRAARYVAYFPSLILWSAINLRDAWIVALILFVTSRALRVQDHPRLGTLAVLIAGIYALTLFRSYILAAVAFPILLSFVVRQRRKMARNLAIGSLVGVALISTDVSRSLQRGIELADLDRLQQMRQFTGFGGSQAEAQADVSTPLAALRFLPTGLVIFLLSPLPWEVTTPRQAATMPEMLLLYYLLVPIVVGVSGLIRRHLADSLVVMLITAALTVGYSLGQANVGTAYRYRAQVLPFFLIFGAYGIELRRQKRSAVQRAPAPSVR